MSELLIEQLGSLGAENAFLWLFLHYTTHTLAGVQVKVSEKARLLFSLLVQVRFSIELTVQYRQKVKGGSKEEERERERERGKKKREKKKKRAWPVVKVVARSST